MRTPVAPIAAAAAFLVSTAHAIELKFAPPDFETEYAMPYLFIPPPDGRNTWWEALILFGALSLTTWLVFKARSRRGLFGVSVFSLLFFGFYRQGCICPVGSTQNVAAAIFLPDVAVSWIIVAFFVLPLLFSLFFGRVFCASVCPLGAMQELVAIAPIRISPALERVLGLGKYIYLGLAILGVATGAGFLICRYDPFVRLYRLNDNFGMLIAAALILLIGVFIARPYCRFLCPYGVLLGWMSRFSKFHLQIPPSPCVECRLCEDSCPYNAIDMPTPRHLVEDPAQGKKRIRGLVFLAPVFILLGALGGYMMYEPLSRMHPTVSLSERIALEDRGIITERGNLQADTFRVEGKTAAQLHAESLAIKEQFKTGGALLGAFLALIISIKLIELSVIKKRTIFEPHKETCFSCGRCYPYCPVEEGA
ncbi:MAG: 4Fe-4S binding protein [Candidatus Hydrogenedentes bacterium]|nr:4Fe-4S binding protein [Candidatus Hydrogenedentota bacterium]